MWKEISECQWWCFWLFFVVGDILIGVVILLNFVVSYWMGIWLIYDFYFYFDDICLFVWICYVVGNVCVFICIFSQYILWLWFILKDGKRIWGFLIVLYVYKYVMVLIGVMQWCGLVYVVVLYIGMMLISVVVGLIGVIIFLVLFRNYIGILIFFFIMVLDLDVVDFFMILIKFFCEVYVFKFGIVLICYCN